MQACFLPADILLPDAAADFEKWAVVACDQFTSQPEYWRKAAEIVGDAPSTLNLVYPEAYLAEGDARIAAIRQAMEDYMRRGVLQTRVKDGFVLVRRVTESARHGRACPRDGGDDSLAHPAARAHPAGGEHREPARDDAH